MNRSSKRGSIASLTHLAPDLHGALSPHEISEGRYRSILRTSQERHGRDARTRYAALLLAALQRVAENPDGLSTSGHAGLRPGMRSFHIRHSRNQSREAPVANPVHVIYYRAVEPGVVEIVRVLHERMEPRLHVGAAEEG